MNTAYLLLGSNMNHRELMLTKAKQMISGRIGTISGFSSIYETEPWGFEAKELFLNQVVMTETSMAPVELLTTIHSIEEFLGRRNINSTSYASRPIDIDILFYNNHILNLAGLIIPHPGIQDRKFTLLPLSELDDKYIHPIHKKTVGKLLDECNDKSLYIRRLIST